MTQTHTQGPWRYAQPTESWGAIYAENGRHLATVGMSDIPSFAESEANAHLIAAAPELLVALELALQAHDDDKSWEDLAIATIKKARRQSC